jgi:transcriptional regulator with XRE-family HTH domain
MNSHLKRERKAVKSRRTQALSDVDKYIGQHIRARRLVVGMTQKQLADKLNITFQQIQKYESGADRIASSRLWQIAVALGTSPAVFFPVTALVVDGVTSDDTATDVANLVDRPDTIKLLRVFKRVGGAKRRAMLIEIVEALRNIRARAAAAHSECRCLTLTSRAMSRSWGDDSRSRRPAMMTLQEFVTGCSEAAANVFQLRGHISPMWHCVTRAGEHMITPSPSDNKDTAVALLRAAFELHDVVRYVFIDEAWQVNVTGRLGEDAEALSARGRKLGGTLQDHPERVEVLLLAGEDETAGMCTARRVIIRPPHGKAYLGPLEIDTPGFSEGRMIGLLPQRGTRQ